jgi:hypothetical protein
MSFPFKMHVLLQVVMDGMICVSIRSACISDSHSQFQ